MAATASQRASAWFFRNHRWLGIVPCIFVMLWGLSGVMHPIMSRLSPQPVAMTAPPVTIALHEALTPVEVLRRAGIEAVTTLQVVSLEDATYYQVSVPQSTTALQTTMDGSSARRRYFDVASGVELPDGDARYAEYLARHFTGERSAALLKTTLITAFTDDYPSVNRLLPVWRVDFARGDGLRAYIETYPGRVGALVDDTRAVLGTIFQWLHTWSFAHEWDAARKAAITALLLLTVVSAISGAWMYVFMYRRGTLSAAHAPLRRWHRGIAIATALATVLFVISAIWHVWMDESPNATVAPPRMASSSLELPDQVRQGLWSRLAVVNVAGEVHYLMTPVTAHQPEKLSSEHAHHDASRTGAMLSQAARSVYISAASGDIVADAQRRHVVALARQYSGLDDAQVHDVEPVFKFEGEYGFINKRLPVWRVRYATADDAVYYVEPLTGALAAIVRNADRAEGYSFAYLHKYHWLDFAGKNVRDLVMAAFALGLTLTAGSGLWLFAARYSAAQ